MFRDRLLNGSRDLIPSRDDAHFRACPLAPVRRRYLLGVQAVSDRLLCRADRELCGYDLDRSGVISCRQLD
jgi:hypothetical protein